jgi:hypothetical protein
MKLRSSSPSFAGKPGLAFVLLAPVVAASFISAHAEMPFAHEGKAMNPQVATTGASIEKKERARVNSSGDRPFRVTVINLSGKSRQSIVGESKIDLPVAERVTLWVRVGDTLRVVSDTDSNISERFVISERDAAHVMAVP